MWIFFKAILSHISCAIMIFQESICLWDVPLNTQKTAANVHQGTLIWVMGLLVNWSMATPGAGAGNRRKSIREMILISFPMLLVWTWKGGGEPSPWVHYLFHKAPVCCTAWKRTLLPPKSAATVMPFSFKTCKNIVITIKTVAFANRFH